MNQFGEGGDDGVVWRTRSLNEDADKIQESISHALAERKKGRREWWRLTLNKK